MIGHSQTVSGLLGTTAYVIAAMQWPVAVYSRWRIIVILFDGPEGAPIDEMLIEPRRFHECNPYSHTKSDMR